MATQWIETVRSSRQLRVCADRSMQAAGWQGMFERALADFNQLARSKRLGVSVVAHDDPPARSGLGGADVLVSTANGAISTDYEGPNPGTLGGEGLHGLTRLFRRQPGDEIVKAFVYVPANPLGSAPQGRRSVGPGVRLVILAHELLHCCGLDNNDHASTGLFQGVPSFEPGHEPDGDRISSGMRRPASMPPLVLDDRTVASIRSLWRGSRRASLEGLAPSLDSRRAATPDGLNPRAGGRRPGPTGVA